MVVVFLLLEHYTAEHLVQDVQDMVLELNNLEHLVRYLVDADGLVVLRLLQGGLQLSEREWLVVELELLLEQLCDAWCETLLVLL